MWRFIEGVKPPEKKPKLSEEQKLVRDREYDNLKRVRTFQESWQRDRPWLSYIRDRHVMVCDLCSTFSTSESDRKSAFVLGCSNLKLNTIHYHEKSEQHRQSESRKKAKENPPKQSIAGQILENMNTAVLARLINLYRNAHAIVKNRRPFTDFIWMCDLDEAKGVDIGKTYRNDKQIVTFTHFMAEVERQKLVQNINEARFLSIICDGCTDSSAREEEIVYVRICNRGDIKTSFLAINSPERADAQGIFNIIKTSLDEANIANWAKKIVGFGSDGASVMMGRHGGVVSKLKDLQPKLQGIHCFAHRLELTYKDVVKQAPYYSKMSTLLSGLYKFYLNSPLNRSNLKRSYESLGTSPRMPTRVDGTRWLPHTEGALDNFWIGYQAIKLNLEQLPTQKGASVDAISKSKAYLTIMKDPGILMFMALMTDIICLLSKLSLMLQNQDTTVAGIKIKLDVTKDILAKYKTQDGPKMKQLQQISDSTGVHFDNIKETFNKATRVTLLTNLINRLEHRFSDAEDGVIGACKIADFRLWPVHGSANKELQTEFGNTEIEVLVDHFRPVLESSGVVPDAIQVEWDLLKSLLYSQYPDVSKLKWSTVFISSSDDCPNVLALMDLIRTLPAHSAEAERGFSEMKLVKTDWRSCLRPGVLSDLLFVMLHTSDILSYDPTPAIHLWNTSGGRIRRPTQAPHGPRVSNSDDDESDDETAFTQLYPQPEM